MGMGELKLQPGSLWAKVQQRTAHAIDCGALQSIATECEFMEEEGVRFLIRIAADLVRKEQDREAASKGQANPFLPYDEDLFVADISETHVCLLNKFNVIDHHLLIVTRSFEDQESLLTLRDFEALWACLMEFEGLAFYNAGKCAGASQRHKHLQIVPLPLAPMGPRIPIEPLLESLRFQGSLGTVSGLPFLHAIVRIDPVWTGSPSEAAQNTLESYRTMLEALGLCSSCSENGTGRGGPYNLLITREWMLLVPRSQESFMSIAVNALGFAGVLLVRNEHELEILRQHGPLTILKRVAMTTKG